MRFEPGFLNGLREDLASVRPDIKQRLARKGAMTEEKLLSLVTDTSTVQLDAEHAGPIDVINYDSLSSWQPACDAIREGKIAFVVLAGGVSSQTGDPLALMKLPKLGIPLMVNNLFQSGFVTYEGETLQVPTWFMTAPGLMTRFANQLNGLSLMNEGVIFEQFESYRLGVDNRLLFTERGVPELYPTGHGDVGAALVESGVLDDNPKVEHVVIINCNNMLASLDPMILTQHLSAQVDVTCEVVESQVPLYEGGGILVWFDNKLQVVETFLFPPEFIDGARYHSTNSMIIDVRALKTKLAWSYHRRRKAIENRLVVQYERMMEQYTTVFKSQYVLVDRARRYMPIRSEVDLERADTILNGNRK